MPTRNDAERDRDELRPEYDFSTLRGGVRGKHFERATAGTTLVLLEPDVAEAFPDGTTVNQAPRALIKVADTRASSARATRAPKPTRAKRRAKPKPRAPAARG